MCKVLEVSVSGDYAWRQHTPSSRQLVDEQLMERIRHDYEHSHGIYGSRRLQAALRVEGSSCGRKRVVRLMRRLGICARRPAHRSRTTDSQPDNPVAENLLAQEFTAEAPNTKWVTDITGGGLGKDGSMWRSCLICSLAWSWAGRWEHIGIRSWWSKPVKWRWHDDSQNQGCCIIQIEEATIPVKRIGSCCSKRVSK